MVPMICGLPVGSTVLAKKMLKRRDPSGSFTPEALALFAAKAPCWLFFHMGMAYERLVLFS